MAAHPHLDHPPSADPGRWSRRSISVGALFLAAAIAVPTAPLWLGLAYLVDLATGRTIARAGAFVLWYLVHSVVGVALTAWYELGRRVGVVDAAAYSDRHHRLQHWWSGRLFSGLRTLFDLTLEVDGDADGPERPIILLSRHVSTGDTLLPLVALAIPRQLRVRYVLKRELLWDPCLDIVGQRVPNAFVRRGGSDSAADLARVRRLADDLDPRDCIVLFPEGTRFTPERRARILARLAERDEPRRLARAQALAHLLPPRSGGLDTLLDAAPAADVVLLAHTGLEGVTRMSTLWDGTLRGRTIRVHLQRIPAHTIPRDPAGRVEWLHGHWMGIDQWVGDHTGATPTALSA